MTATRLLWKREYSDARCQAFPAKLDPVQLAAFRVREKLRTIQLGLSARGAVGVGLARQRGGAAVSAWWLDGGAPSPVAVYQPKGAASLAASYVNLVNPGTYNAAPGVAPTFDAATGWTFNGSTQYLTTGVVPASGYTLLVRVSEFGPSGAVYIAGCRTNNSARIGVGANSFSARWVYVHGGLSTGALYSGYPISGVVAATALYGYLNGTQDATISAWSGTNSQPLVIGAYNNNGLVTGHAVTSIQAVVIWDTSTNHDVWLPAVSASMAAL